MGPLAFLSSLYDHDTLDTRFTTASSTPYQNVIEARLDPSIKKDSAAKERSRAQPSKWKTPEFYLYYVVFAVAIPYMFWITYDVSRGISLPLLFVRPQANKDQKLILDTPNLSDGYPRVGFLDDRSTFPMRNMVCSARICLIWALFFFSTRC